MHKTNVDFTDEEVMDLASAVRTRIDFLADIARSEHVSEERKVKYQAEIARQHALYFLFIGSDYDA